MQRFRKIKKFCTFSVSGVSQHPHASVPQFCMELGPSLSRKFFNCFLNDQNRSQHFWAIWAQRKRAKKLGEVGLLARNFFIKLQPNPSQELSDSVWMTNISQSVFELWECKESRSVGRVHTASSSVYWQWPTVRLFVPRTRTTYGDRIFAVDGTRMWKSASLSQIIINTWHIPETAENLLDSLCQ